jgi:hypothetical protein
MRKKTRDTLALFQLNWEQVSPLEDWQQKSKEQPS